MAMSKARGLCASSAVRGDGPVCAPDCGRPNGDGGLPAGRPQRVELVERFLGLSEGALPRQAISAGEKSFQRPERSDSRAMFVGDVVLADLQAKKARSSARAGGGSDKSGGRIKASAGELSFMACQCIRASRDAGGLLIAARLVMGTAVCFARRKPASNSEGDRGCPRRIWPSRPTSLRGAARLSRPPAPGGLQPRRPASSISAPLSGSLS